MYVSAGHQGSEPVVNQEESNGKLPPCALPGKRQWFTVVTKGRYRPDGTFHFQIFLH